MCTECHKVVTNLLHGKTSEQDYQFHGKLVFKHVKGGVKLYETDFTIRDEKIIKAIEKF